MKSVKLMTLLAAGSLLWGCSDDGQHEDGNGRLRIDFSTDVSLGEQTTRAFSLTAPPEEEFSLRLVNEEKNFDRTWENIKDYPNEGYYIPTGGYTATALYGDIEEEGFGCEAFGATKDFSVVNNTTAQVTMEAKLLHMALTIDYTEQFLGYFPTRNAVILRDDIEIVDFSDDPDGTAFIKPEAFKIRVDHTRQGGQQGFSEYDIEKPEYLLSATYLRVTLDVNDGGVGDAVIVIILNDDVETIEIPIELGDE